MHRRFTWSLLRVENEFQSKASSPETYRDTDFIPLPFEVNRVSGHLPDNYRRYLAGLLPPPFILLTLFSRDLLSGMGSSATSSLEADAEETQDELEKVGWMLSTSIKSGNGFPGGGDGGGGPIIGHHHRNHHHQLQSPSSSPFGDDHDDDDDESDLTMLLSINNK